MTIKYQGKQYEVRGGAWCDVMNTNSQNTIEHNVVDDEKTGRYDIAWVHNPIGGALEYYAINA